MSNISVTASQIQLEQSKEKSPEKPLHIVLDQSGGTPTQRQAQSPLTKVQSGQKLSSRISNEKALKDKQSVLSSINIKLRKNTNSDSDSCLNSSHNLSPLFVLKEEIEKQYPKSQEAQMEESNGSSKKSAHEEIKIKEEPPEQQTRQGYKQEIGNMMSEFNDDELLTSGEQSVKNRSSFRPQITEDHNMRNLRSMLSLRNSQVIADSQENQSEVPASE